MVSATHQAAGANTALLEAIDRIIVPHGSWSYRDAGRLVAQALGVSATTVSGDLGVLQTSLIADAVEAVTSGRSQVCLVVGAEARRSAQLASRAGADNPETTQDDTVAPDEVISPADLVINQLEIEHRLFDAVEQYALMETALRFADGQDPGDHRRVVAELGARMNEVATHNPNAAFAEARSAEFLATPSDANRRLALPYNKWDSTQWSVDQGAALLIASHSTAAELGVDDAHLLHPQVVAGSDTIIPVSERVVLHECQGAGIVGRAALDAAGLSVQDLDLIDLYSCFPVAVRMQMRGLGLDPGATPTVTGGMASAGGPFNNYVLQAVARCHELLLSGHGNTALVTALSGMATKQGAFIFGTAEPPTPYQTVDCTTEVEAATPRCALVGDHTGPGRIETYTVRHVRGEPATAIALVAIGDTNSTASPAERTRVIASTEDPDVLAALSTGEWCDQPVSVSGRSFALTQT